MLLLLVLLQQSLLNGRLDQREYVLRVKSTVGRDVHLEEVDAMIAKLSRW